MMDTLWVWLAWWSEMEPRVETKICIYHKQLGAAEEKPQKLENMNQAMTHKVHTNASQGSN